MDAEEIIRRGDLFTIEDLDDSVPPEHQVNGLYVTFTDYFAHTLDFLVTECALWLTTYPGVIEVDHPDREVISVEASELDRDRLNDALDDWWKRRLREEGTLPD